MDVPKPLPLPLPLLPLISPQNILYANMVFTYALMSGLAVFMVRDLIDSSNQNKDLLDLSNQNKNLPKSPLNIPFHEKLPTKRVVGLHLCSPCYVNQYVIFKKKIKII